MALVGWSGCNRNFNVLQNPASRRVLGVLVDVDPGLDQLASEPESKRQKAK